MVSSDALRAAVPHASLQRSIRHRLPLCLPALPDHGWSSLRGALDPQYGLSHQAFHSTGDFGPQGVVGRLMPEFRYLAGSRTPFRGYEYAREFDTMLIEPPIYCRP